MTAESDIAEADCQQAVSSDRDWIGTVRQELRRIQIPVAGKPSGRDVDSIGQMDLKTTMISLHFVLVGDNHAATLFGDPFSEIPFHKM